MKKLLRRLLALTGLAGILAAWCKRMQPGCVSGTVRWADTPHWSTGGLMTNVASFNAFVEAERPCYRHYPEGSAQAVLGMDPSGASPQSQFTLSYGPSAGSGETDVVITQDSEGDDSVAAVRYRLTFVDDGFIGGTAGNQRLLNGLREVRCHPGRGHTDWGTGPCV